MESDGSSCSDFANDGKRNIEIPDAIGSYGANVMISHPDGGFVIAGTVKFGFSEEGSLYLLKIDDAGEVDNTFGTNGLVTYSLGAVITTGVNDIIIDSENKIVTGGGAFNNDELDNNFFISRFNLDGTLDNTFGNNGVNVLQLNANESISDLLLNPNGQIIASGGTGGFPSNLMIARYNRDGELDNTFGGNGYTITPVTSNFNGLDGIDFGPNDEIIAAGFSKLTNRRALLAQYNNSTAVNTVDITHFNDFAISPNPFHENLRIGYNSELNKMVSITLFDMTGNKILSKNHKVFSGQNELEISDLDNLPSGQFFVLIATDSGTTLRSKVSKL